MKYYVVSEEELQELIDTTCEFAVSGSMTCIHALAACRARPVTFQEFDDRGTRVYAWEEVKV
jgi:hypothetical protein